MDSLLSVAAPLGKVLPEVLISFLLAAAFLSTRAAYAHRVSAGVYDGFSAYARGLVSRRWLFENAALLLIAVGLTVLLLCRSLGVPLVGLAATLHLPFAGVSLLAVAYLAAAVRAAGDYGDGPEDVPRTQLPELRRPRAAYFRLRLLVRMAALRAWIAAVGCSIACWELGALLSPCFGAGLSAPSECSSGGVVRAALEALVGPAAGLPSLGTLAAAALNAAMLTLPIALGCVAAFSSCGWSAADSEGVASAPGAECWVWPAGQAGEVPWQTRPPRLGSAATAAEALQLGSQLPRPLPGPDTPLAPAPRRYPDSAVALCRVAAAAGASRGSSGGGLRVVILSLGTRGDVQPYIAVSLALRDAGHTPVICASADFKAFIEEAGIEYAPSGLARLVQPDTWTSAIRTVADMILASGPTHFQTFLYDDMYAGFVAATEGADVVVGSGMTVTMALDISEARGIPVWVAKLCPENPSFATVPPGFVRSEIGWLNYARSLWYWASVGLALHRIGAEAKSNACRKRLLGLGPPAVADRIADMNFTPQLLGFSRHLFPKPADYEPWHFEVGFWQVQDAEAYHARAENALRAFLAQPDAEVDDSVAGAAVEAAQRSLSSLPTAVVTFGSMTLARDSLLADCVSVLLDEGFKVVVLTGWKEQHPAGVPTREQDPRVFSLPEASHDWLFANVALVVHHGGAGTTGRALASGVPSLVIPVLRWADQPTWGALVEARGVGVVVREESPTRDDISAALQRLLAGPRGSRVSDRANVLGVVVRAEPSAETAVALLESCLCNLVLRPADADAVHPLAEPAPQVNSLSRTQRMCLRHCIPCHRLRTALGVRAAGDTPDPAALAAAWGGQRQPPAQTEPQPEREDAREDSPPRRATVSDVATPPADVPTQGLRHRAGGRRGRGRASSPPPPPPPADDEGSDGSATDTEVDAVAAAASRRSAAAASAADCDADSELLAASEAKRARSHAAAERMAALLHAP